MLELIGKVVRVYHSTNLVPNLDARVLTSINPRVDIPRIIDIKLWDESFTCILETLGGLNSCFLCRREGHIRRSCPILSRRSKPNVIPHGVDVNKDGPASPNSSSKLAREPSVRDKLDSLSKAINIVVAIFPKAQPIDLPIFESTSDFGSFNAEPPPLGSFYSHLPNGRNR